MSERNINVAMLEYLPKYYEDVREVRTIIDAKSKILKQLKDDTYDILNQFYIDTATWGLTRWETLIGIKNPERYNKSTFENMEKQEATYSDIEGISWSEFETKYPISLEERRSIIKAKIRGQGTVTKEHIKAVALSYANGEVDVVEDFANYRILMRFVGEDAIPSNLEQVEKTIREITPAHLLLEYTLAYLLIRDIDQVMTLSDLESKPLSEFAGGGIRLGE